MSNYPMTHRVLGPSEVFELTGLSEPQSQMEYLVSNGCMPSMINGAVQVYYDDVCYSMSNPRAESNPTFLYRYFDAKGTLLYVGISKSFFNRLARHSNSSGWFAHARKITMEPFPTRKEALIKEKATILAERPLFNRMHNK